MQGCSEAWYLTEPWKIWIFWFGTHPRELAGNMARRKVSRSPSSHRSLRFSLLDGWAALSPSFYMCCWEGCYLLVLMGWLCGTSDEGAAAVSLLSLFFEWAPLHRAQQARGTAICWGVLRHLRLSAHAQERLAEGSHQARPVHELERQVLQDGRQGRDPVRCHRAPCRSSRELCRTLERPAATGATATVCRPSNQALPSRRVLLHRRLQTGGEQPHRPVPRVRRDLLDPAQRRAPRVVLRLATRHLPCAQQDSASTRTCHAQPVWDTARQAPRADINSERQPQRGLMVVAIASTRGYVAALAIASNRVVALSLSALSLPIIPNRVNVQTYIWDPTCTH